MKHLIAKTVLTILRFLINVIFDCEYCDDLKYISKNVKNEFIKTFNNDDESKENAYEAFIYHKRTRENRYASAYSDRISMAYYMAAPSAKLSFLVKICHQVCRVERKKLLMFTDWPVTLWLTAAFLMNIGFDILIIRSVHTAEERPQTCAQFNDSTNPVEICCVHSRLPPPA